MDWALSFSIDLGSNKTTLTVTIVTDLFDKTWYGKREKMQV